MRARRRDMSFRDELRQRTFEFSVQCVVISRRLPATWEAREIARQLLRSGTSVAANFRGACRGRSRREFIAKLGIAVEEADETVMWLDVLERTDIARRGTVEPIRREAGEILAILARSLRTARENDRAARSSDYPRE
jgi:four helix bundle protein